MIQLTQSNFQFNESHHWPQNCDLYYPIVLHNDCQNGVLWLVLPNCITQWLSEWSPVTCITQLYYTMTIIMDSCDLYYLIVLHNVYQNGVLWLVLPNCITQWLSVCTPVTCIIQLYYTMTIRMESCDLYYPIVLHNDYQYALLLLVLSNCITQWLSEWSPVTCITQLYYTMTIIIESCDLYYLIVLHNAYQYALLLLVLPNCITQGLSVCTPVTCIIQLYYTMTIRMESCDLYYPIVLHNDYNNRVLWLVLPNCITQCL